jgi:hypothetical protein
MERLLKKLKLPYDPAVPGQQIRIHERHQHTCLYSSTIYNSQAMNQPRWPVTDDWIKKMGVIYTYVCVCVCVCVCVQWSTIQS